MHKSYCIAIQLKNAVPPVPAAFTCAAACRSAVQGGQLCTAVCAECAIDRQLCVRIDRLEDAKAEDPVQGVSK